MSYPVLHVYLGSVFNPDTGDIFDEPSSWTDITSDVREASWHRGRQRDLDEIGAGGGTLLLKNEDRRWDPTNPDSSAYPLAQRAVKIEAVHNFATYSLFRGWAHNWQVKWDAQWADAYSETVVDLVDGITLLQDYPVTGGGGSAAIATQIDDYLNLAGWPAGLTDTTGGTTVLAAPTDTGVWAAIQAAVNSSTSLNVCFIDGRGYVVFPGGGASGAIFGDEAGELPYTSAGLNYGQDLVFNEVTITAEGGTPQTATTVGPRGLNAYKTYTRSTLNTSDAAALTMAQAILANYWQPRARPEQMVVRPGNDSATWVQVLGLELEDTLTLRRRPPGGGEMFQQTMKVVGLEHHAVPAYADWTATYRLAGQFVQFPSTDILDTFNRANEGPPMTGWTTISSGLKVLTNQCAPNDTDHNNAARTTAMSGPDVEAYVTIATHPVAAGESAVGARIDSAGGGIYATGYWVIHSPSGGTDPINIYRTDPAPTLLQGFSQDLAAGDKLGIRCRGSTIEAWASVSGVWQLIGTATDTTYAGTGSNNKIALHNYGNGGSGARYDNFGGGTIT
jgi:hypothetical protein